MILPDLTFQAKPLQTDNVYLTIKSYETEYDTRRDQRNQDASLR